MKHRRRIILAGYGNRTFIRATSSGKVGLQTFLDESQTFQLVRENTGQGK
jgi:hypothetical protein